MAPTLGYWWVRGLGQPIRFLLAYLNIEHNSKIYSNVDDWFAIDKNGLNLELPNLPYFIDGEVKVTESAAIPVYIIKKSNRPDLLGQNADGSFNFNEVRVQQLIGAFRDVYKEYQNICSNPEFVTIKEKSFESKLSPTLTRVTNILGDQDFLCGNLTYADFWFYEMLNFYKHIFPESITPCLAAYISRFEKLPGISEYLELPDINLNEFFPAPYFKWSGPS